MDKLVVEADGLTIVAILSAEDGDIRFSIDAGESYVFSPATAKIIGLALIGMADKEKS